MYILQNSALLPEDTWLLNTGGMELEQVSTVSDTINNITFVKAVGSTISLSVWSFNCRNIL